MIAGPISIRAVTIDTFVTMVKWDVNLDNFLFFLFDIAMIIGIAAAGIDIVTGVFNKKEDQKARNIGVILVLIATIVIFALAALIVSCIESTCDAWVMIWLVDMLILFIIYIIMSNQA